MLLIYYFAEMLCACLVAKSCPTVCDPTDCSLPDSSVHGVLQARILEWDAMPSSRRSSRLREVETVSPAAPVTPALQADSLPLSQQGSPLKP